ncbi:MAG TPA: hypothetical protein VJB98_01695 [Candidatus Paceibacterota bacterium]
MAEHDKGLVEDLKQKLYKRGTFKADISRAQQSLPRTEVAPDWDKEEEPVTRGLLNPSFLKKFFLVALLFFVLAVAASAFIIWSGSNVVSADNLEITLKGPTSLKGGDELGLSVAVANNNATSLEFVDLIVTFPPGTREADNLEKELVRYRKNLGTLNKGDVANESVKAVLFGEAGKEQEVKVTVEYRTTGSNAIFEKNKTYTVLISSSPLDLSLSLPDEVNAGNQVQLVIDVASRATSELSDILVNASYPSGFRFKDASPKPIFGNNVWRIGDMQGDIRRRITITGVLDGEDNEKKLFKVVAGRAKETSDNEVGVPYGSTFATVVMRRSFVDLAASFSGQAASEIISAPSQTLRGSIAWTNNLGDKLINGTVSVRLSGNALDQSSVSVGSGSYRSLDNTITWKEQHDQSLALIEPGSSGQISFDISTLSSDKLGASGIRNPFIQADVTFEATRVTEDGSGDIVRTSVSRLIRLNSALDLGAKAVYTVGPFANSGPMPPKVNVETTYTLVWSVLSASNDLNGVTVRGLLPSHTRFLGNVSPSGADLRFEATTGIVSWNVGRLEASPSSVSPREVAFQIALLPSLPQADQTLPLMTNMNASGRDLFTGETISDSVPLIDTRISEDPNFQESWSKIAN